MQERIHWVDWMKTIGMYLIVLGHFFSIGNTYIYVFSVPLFFFISGFLTKREIEAKVFWKKLCYNLAVPMFLIAFLNFLIGGIFNIYAGKEFGNVIIFLISSIFGFHEGVVNLWFVYTLILLKILLQYLPKRAIWPAAVLFLLLAVLVKRCPIEIMGYSVSQTPNAIVDVCLAYPFFMVGFFAKKYKDKLCSVKITWKSLLPISISIVLWYLCGKYNGSVYLYICNYGNYLLLCLAGSLSGIFLTYIVCRFLEKFKNTVTFIISKGSIIILGFHSWLIICVRHFFRDVSWMDFLWALLILLSFIPVIMMVEKYFPLLMGKYRKSSNKIQAVSEK